MREKSTGLMIFGIIAIFSLFIGSGLIFYTLADGTPGTWKYGEPRSRTHGWPQATAGVTAYVSARYNVYGNRFDSAYHYVNRFAGGAITVQPLMTLYFSYQTEQSTYYGSRSVYNSNVWGMGYSYGGGPFKAVSTKGFSEFRDGFYTLFSLTTDWASVYP